MQDADRIEINAFREECLAAIECVLVAVQNIREEVQRLARENAELRSLVHGAMESTVTD